MGEQGPYFPAIPGDRAQPCLSQVPPQPDRRLEDRLEHQLQGCLHGAVPHGRASAHMTRMAAAQLLVTSFGSRPAEIATGKPDQPEMLSTDIR
jgi:hypothetical protein